MTNPNDQATPIRLNEYDTRFGLTKREYFAAMAMQGLLAADGNATLSSRISVSVKAADHLIEELNKEST